MSTRFAKVEGYDSLVRDRYSHAIISSSDEEYLSHKRNRENALRQRELIKKQSEEIDTLKSEMQEIKQMLSTLIKGK
jgi:hypothetical protein